MVGDLPVRIRLLGTFSIRSGADDDLTPASMKTQGLVALLATSPEMKRSRTWLQDRLWSDRAPKQASGSLRQALHDLKRALGPFADVVSATRSVVSLDPAQVAVVTEASSDYPEDDQFLSGIDVRDPEFEDWLRSMRSHFAEASARNSTPQSAPDRTIRYSPPRRLRVALTGSVTPPDADAALLESAFLDYVQRSITELFDVEFSFGLPDLEMSVQPDFIVAAQGALNISGEYWLRASLEYASDISTLWSHQTKLGAGDVPPSENPRSLSLAHQLIRAFGEQLLRSREDYTRPTPLIGDTLAATAIRKMFTMRSEEVSAAESLLSAAMEAKPRGLYHAWRAQLISIRHVERQKLDAQALREESRECIRRALESEPLNSNVLAAAANARLIFEGDVAQCSALARQSVAANKSNPLAWWSWSNANLYAGELDASYAAAVTAQAIGAQSTLEFWTSFQRALTAAVRGDFDEALGYAALSNALAPSFRPPLRYLAAVASKVGRMPAAGRALEQLSILESEFSVERMVNDPDYPVSMMRKANLIEPEHLYRLM